uniref:Uncharacterized protein n=1 Tax=Mucochytrium quahogii TaxID=96639 RepID=A0A7S2WJN4_9STRA|mmetsp:Transcript_17105/g.27670  ORF Transcript_17105/g.27670 Transcript_17105/m.27670 type:complete len:223 (+) Transcript_17105:126-794(+)|eukprot:CAMPEP_0203750830 /NCGR_PEP_ID=MMETSP0098-20131031/5001_1 /ASSEMBLY_ACC=CAM_ASM_000208 /TAXON_ID=96639 /ORGANISM=" , Strain NY0313808BC1" /LENGTH=222 /DNA_ID=CAMNT_0050640293 /DNA_START=98 /DNA_END=766 /DNA_ORIENTATION=+
MRVQEFTNALLAASAAVNETCTLGSGNCDFELFCGVDSKCHALSSISTCSELHKLVPGVPEMDCSSGVDPSITVRCSKNSDQLGVATETNLTHSQHCVGENAWCDGPDTPDNEKARFDSFYDAVINDCNNSGNVYVQFDFNSRIISTPWHRSGKTVEVLEANITQSQQEGRLTNLKELVRKQHLGLNVHAQGAPTKPPTSNSCITRELYFVLLTAVVLVASF